MSICPPREEFISDISSGNLFSFKIVYLNRYFINNIQRTQVDLGPYALTRVESLCDFHSIVELWIFYDITLDLGIEFCSLILIEISSPVNPLTGRLAHISANSQYTKQIR